ncbi:hypothetical protein TNCV_223281 [Trichonephila clavipes]|nr:hypothetical protein TNCV_223281 [Trichonephila clavipes]
MEPQSRRAHWRFLNYLKNPYGQPKKMALHHDYRNIPKFIYNKIQTPTVMDRFEYSGNNVIPSQWIGKSYSRDHSKEITRLSIPGRLKNWKTYFRTSASSTFPSKSLLLHTEQTKTPSSFNSTSTRPLLKRSESILTSSAPWIPQVASSPSTTGYFVLSGMLVFLMVVVCCYLCKRKKQKWSIQYTHIHTAEVNTSLCSIASEASHFPFTSVHGTESESKSSVILNMEEVNTLPYVNVLVYNGYKFPTNVSQSSSSKKTSESSFPVSERDFVRHYWASNESSTTQMSGCEQKTTASDYLSSISPSEQAKRYQMCGRNPADFSSPQSPSEKKSERCNELMKNATDPSTAQSTPSFRKQDDALSSNISLNFSSFFPVVEHMLPFHRQSHPLVNCPAGDVNRRIPQSDPYLPCLIKEEPSLDGSSISSGYATAVNISADVKVPPNPNPMPSSKNLKRLLFPSSSESEIEEEHIILHSSRDCFERIKRPK